MQLIISERHMVEAGPMGWLSACALFSFGSRSGISFEPMNQGPVGRLQQIHDKARGFGEISICCCTDGMAVCLRF
jgi:hypothetical protein